MLASRTVACVLNFFLVRHVCVSEWRRSLDGERRSLLENHWEISKKFPDNSEFPVAVPSRSHRLREGTPRIDRQLQPKHVVNKWRLSLGSHCGSLISRFDIQPRLYYNHGSVSLVSLEVALFRCRFVAKVVTFTMFGWSRTL